DELLCLVADLENVVAAERNAHESGPRIVRAVEDVSGAAGPAAELRHPLRDGGLPLLDLVAVREQRFRNGEGGVLAILPRVELSFGDGLHEGADVGDEGEAFIGGENSGAVSHLLKLNAGRVQAEIAGGGG